MNAAALHLLAHVADRPVAIAAGQVGSVVDVATVVPVPRVGPAICGLTAMRSTVVTVIDARAALGLAPGVPRGRAVVTNVDGHDYAVLVDSLEDVAPFVAEPLDGLAFHDSHWRAIGTGIVDHAGEPILVIDLHALVTGIVPLH